MDIDNYEEHQYSYDNKLMLLKQYIIDKTRDLNINCKYEHLYNEDFDILKIIITK